MWHQRRREGVGLVKDSLPEEAAGLGKLSLPSYQFPREPALSWVRAPSSLGGSLEPSQASRQPPPQGSPPGWLLILGTAEGQPGPELVTSPLLGQMGTALPTLQSGGEGLACGRRSVSKHQNLCAAAAELKWPLRTEDGSPVEPGQLVLKLAQNAGRGH